MVSCSLSHSFIAIFGTKRMLLSRLKSSNLFFHRCSPNMALLTTSALKPSLASPIFQPFITISAPQLKNNLTPSQKKITWSFGGSINAAEADLK